MKIYHYLLSTMLISSIALSFGSCSSDSDEGEAPEQGQNPTPENPQPESPVEPDSDKKQDIQQYFSNYINGLNNPSIDTTVIAIADISKQQDSVWQAWARANEANETLKLPALVELSQGVSNKWAFPSQYESPNTSMPFYWGYKGTKPEKGYPLFIYLHGSGPKAQEWETGLYICKQTDDSPSVHFVPQIPNTGNYYRWYQRAKQYIWERLIKLSMLDDQFDPNKIYFFGISEGGYGSQRLASYYADYLAGAGPMAGGEPLRNAPVENCRHIAFSLRTGANDDGFSRNKLTQYAKSEFERLQKLYPGDFVHNIELIPGMGHAIDYYKTTPWLKQYSRNPYPKAFNWENFELDGRYRKGFYNLAVLKNSNDNNQSRTYYEMNIQDNKIDLKVQLVTYTTTQSEYGVELEYKKDYTNATKGKFIVYLNDKLVDLTKEVTLNVNGREMYKGIVKPEMRHLINSCATFFDSERLYPAAIEIDLEK